MKKFEGASVPNKENKLSLKTVEFDGREVMVTDSREVALKVNKEHKNLLRDINTYIKYLAESKIELGNFFIESSYEDSNNQERPCYLLTKQGCEMVANKMTGQKGVLFTATYVKAFNDMQESLKGGQASLSDEDILSRALDIQTKKLKEKEEQIKQLQAEIKEKDKPLYIPTNYKTWRTETTKILNTCASRIAWYTDEPISEIIRGLRHNVYKILSEEMNIKLDRRLNSRKRRALKEGATKSEIEKISYLDVIGSEKRLINGYVRIVKDIALRF